MTLPPAQLHLVRLRVDPRALSAFAVGNGLSDDDAGYALHRALRDRFGAAGPQPFRYLPDHKAGPHVLGYAADKAGFHDAAGLPAADALLGAVFTGAPEGHDMPAEWREGARYRFEVRVRPVVRFGKSVRAARRDRPGAWQNRASEIDAFVAACERAGADGDGSADLDRETVYLDWLGARLAPAATMEAGELRLLRRVRTFRSSHGKGPSPRVEGPDALLAGTLAVTDPAAFAALLARGIGRHAAFGYGMLLLSPPGRPG